MGMFQILDTHIRAFSYWSRTPGENYPSCRYGVKPPTLTHCYFNSDNKEIKQFHYVYIAGVYSVFGWLLENNYFFKTPKSSQLSNTFN